MSIAHEKGAEEDRGHGAGRLLEKQLKAIFSSLCATELFSRFLCSEITRRESAGIKLKLSDKLSAIVHAEVQAIHCWVIESLQLLHDMAASERAKYQIQSTHVG